ncbi:Protein of unknown function, partial [Gryllus bimaculatus]
MKTNFHVHGGLVSILLLFVIVLKITSAPYLA